MNCAICKKTRGSENLCIEIESEGAEGINRASVVRGDIVSVVEGQTVHQQCRKEYICKKSILREQNRSMLTNDVMEPRDYSSMNCAICRKPLDGEKLCIEIGNKGAEGIIRASIARGDTVSVVEGQTVHQQCRKEYTCKKSILREQNRSMLTNDVMEPREKSLSETVPFSFRDYCNDYSSMNCAICRKPLDGEKLCTEIGNKGAEGINRASVVRGDTVSVVEGQTVHEQCRKEYICKKSILREQKRLSLTNDTTTQLGKHRCETGNFCFKDNCIFCGNAITANDIRKSNFYPVRSNKFNKTILDVCDKRRDAWGEVVKSRVVSEHDLQLADAVYHKQCSTHFRNGYAVPQLFRSRTDSPEVKRARVPTSSELERNEAFKHVITHLEDNRKSPIALKELMGVMEDHLKESTASAFSLLTIKKKLTDHFGDSLVFSEITRKKTLVMFRDTASFILEEFYHQARNQDLAAEKTRIVEAAAKIIKADVKLVNVANDTYSPSDMMSLENGLKYLPESVAQFMTVLVAGKNSDVQVASLGQAIMQAVRPRDMITPLQLGLGVQLHHLFGSKFLIDTLHQHGFCCSYTEVQQYERNAAASENTELPGITEDRFVQYVADNVDHNTATIDGYGTFHGMGIIATVTPAIVHKSVIPRKKVSAEDLRRVGRIKIMFNSKQTITSLRYDPLKNVEPMADKDSNIDTLWKISRVLDTPTPSWNGMMQLVRHGDHAGEASVSFLPMIDLDPSSETCIYSTLHFVSQHAQRYNVTPIITFDQPLWLKATLMISNEHIDSPLQKIVLRLGGLHTEMSFLGSIGHIMGGAGLKEALEVVYAPNTVTHMLSGHAIARAIRGHILLYKALSTLIVVRCFEQEDSMTLKDDIDTARKLLSNLLQSRASEDDISSSEAITRLADRISVEENRLASCSRTAALWIQYMQMVSILLKFISAERSGNWNLHLEAVSQMLPFFAASGHNFYTKSCYLYLQMMFRLNERSPEVFASFEKGLHVVRRSNRYWAGLSTDLVIEQVLMRSLKSRGGLTRGGGMTEMQRLVWLLSRPVCTEINQTMQEFTGLTSTPSEQHVDMSSTRQKRDEEDISKLVAFLHDFNPFQQDSELRSIVTGLTAGKNSFPDKAVEIGKKILSEMSGKLVADFGFRRKSQVLTLAAKSAVVIDDELVIFDPEMLFQRLLLTAKTKDENLELLFRYELCPQPASMFDEFGYLREAHKHVLADHLWAKLQTTSQAELPTGNVKYVLDGGALLQRMPWERGASYNDLFEMYASYVSKKYGQAIVVFDGYRESATTKDGTHARRSSTGTAATVNVQPSMTLAIPKVQFLANSNNKQQFIDLLGEKLTSSHCIVHHAKSDADLLIVQTAISSAQIITTVVVGEDTDLLILLLHHVKDDSQDIYLYPEPKKNAKSVKIYNIKSVQAILGQSSCRNLLLGHALLGCDTTSRLHGIGKGLALKLIENSKFTEESETFLAKDMHQDEIEQAGNRAMLIVYNAKKNESLNELRKRLFIQKISSKMTQVKPNSLPPTESAAKFHSLRTYYQVQQWLGVDLDPLQWGWKLKHGKLIPIPMDQPPAPQHLLKAIRCSCKSNCSTNRCSCRRLGIPCTMACSECRGISCGNIHTLDLTDNGFPEEAEL